MSLGGRPSTRNQLRKRRTPLYKVCPRCNLIVIPGTVHEPSDRGCLQIEATAL